MALELERVYLLVLDSLGIGELPDAHLYGDEGSNTLYHISRACGGLALSALGRLGISLLVEVEGTPPAWPPMGVVGRLRELSPGKDTTTGHWEMAGSRLHEPFPVYPRGFPPEVMEPFERAIGRKALGNKPASGTQILEELGEEHLRTGRPIVYTSADSVFQIAAHVGVVPLEELYRWCEIARGILQGKHRVSRVIARPFDGSPGSFFRRPERKDFSVPPPYPTLLDLLREAGLEVIGVGKIGDIFAGRGLTRDLHTLDNADGMRTVEALARERSFRGLLFCNLVDFDSRYGHRNDPLGYGRALLEFDSWLEGFLPLLREGEMLVVTADHGNDPTTPSTDHSREYVPLLMWGPGLEPFHLGTRACLGSLGATLGEAFGVDVSPLCGSSFWREMRWR